VVAGGDHIRNPAGYGLNIIHEGVSIPSIVLKEIKRERREMGETSISRSPFCFVLLRE